MRAADKAALGVLAAAHRAKVERLAERLRPRFESGELAPWPGNDERWSKIKRAEEYDATPNEKLERACWVAVGKGDARAALVLAVAPGTARVLEDMRSIVSRPDGFEPTSLRAGAALVMAAEVLAIAKDRGWLRRERGRKAKA